MGTKPFWVFDNNWRRVWVLLLLCFVKLCDLGNPMMFTVCFMV